MRDEFKGPFLGFTFNGHHSSEFNIVRINTGNRADMPLSPNLKDSTVEIPGNDGLLYFNTQIQQRPFTINFAYDNLNDEQIRNIRNWLYPKQVGKLIFDEEPYKEYTVKVTNVPKLSYLVFDNLEGTDREYKGEGAIALTAYYPYARAPYKFLIDYPDIYDAEGNLLKPNNEWVYASRLLKEGYPILDCNIGDNEENVGETWITGLYNPGDLPSPLNFQFIIQAFNAEASENNPAYIDLSYYNNNSIKQRLILDVTKLELNKRYYVNSKLKVITDAENNTYNDIIAAGDFFYVENTTEAFNSAAPKIYLQGTTFNIDFVLITDFQYDYLYK